MGVPTTLMRRSIIQMTFLLWVCFAAAVVELTTETLEADTHAIDGDNGDWFIEFYDHSCAPCMDLTPVWENVAVALSGRVHVARVDTDANPDVAARFGVTGLASPTLLLLSQGSVYMRYQGERTEEKLTQFATSGFKTHAFVSVPPVDGNLPRDFHISTTSTPPVFTLTDSNFDELTDATNGNAGVWLVDFYAPWCKHCKTLAPIFERLAPQLDGEDIHVALVDADEHVALKSRFGVRRYPTILLFAQGQMYPYMGDRSDESLKAFAQGGYLHSSLGEAVPAHVAPLDPMLSQVVVLLPESFDEVTEIQTGDVGDWIIAFVSPECGSLCKELTPTWHRVSVALSETMHVGTMVLGQVERAAWGKRFGIVGFPTIVVFSDGMMYASYKGERTVDRLFEFATTGFTSQDSMVVPLVGATTPFPFHMKMANAPDDEDDDADDDDDDDDDGNEEDDEESNDDDDDDDDDDNQVCGSNSNNECSGPDDGIDEHEDDDNITEDTPLVRDDDVEDMDDESELDDDDDDDDDEDDDESAYGALDGIGDVVVLSEREFHVFIQSKANTGAWLVAFVDTSSDAWEVQFDTFDAVAQALTDVPHLTLAQLDIEIYPHFKTQLALATNKLSVILFVNGTMTPFTGEWTVAALENFVTHGYKAVEYYPLPEVDHVAVWENVPSGTVVSLSTADGLDRIKRSSKPWMVKFFADWCGHSRRLEPLWHGVAIELQGQVHVGEVDVVAHKALSKLFRLQGLPTILYIADGKMYKYKGKRTLAGLTEFARTEKRPDDALVLPEWHDDVMQTEPVKRSSSRVLPLTDFNFDDRTQVLPWLVVFYMPPLPDVVDEVAMRLKGQQIAVGRVNVDSDKCTAIVASLRPQELTFPALAVVANGSVYHFNDAWTLDAVKTFALGGYRQSRSTQVPDIPIGGRSLVTELSETAVTSWTTNNGTWLVAFQAPWCDECKQLRPVLDSVALNLRGKVQIAMADTSASLKVRFDIQSLPSMWLLSDGNSYFYKGPHTVEALSAFCRGGFKQEEASRLPLHHLATKIATVSRWADEDVVALLVVAVFSALVGLTLGLCLHSSSPRPAQVKTE
ncbi:Aste57867_20957 [Aphanomyces stellatus]|uniref:Aste57867_20957 protein n=1 Tax=Aphanomyces stellatus TaxID=120398 RepID=A0A485LGE1_9STRA|nr:hypothetical protein As57867_020889 [Aphanomyces stellatus]VFT97633.1 Aste57867_20957 [Aphanomyces stellatus]